MGHLKLVISTTVIKRVTFQGVENALHIKEFSIIISLKVIERPFPSPLSLPLLIWNAPSNSNTHKIQRENLDKVVSKPIRKK